MGVWIIPAPLPKKKKNMTQFDYTNDLIALVTTIELANDKGDYEAVKEMGNKLKKLLKKMSKNLNTEEFCNALEITKLITSIV